MEARHRNLDCQHNFVYRSWGFNLLFLVGSVFKHQHLVSVSPRFELRTNRSSWVNTIEPMSPIQSLFRHCLFACSWNVSAKMLPFWRRFVWSTRSRWTLRTPTVLTGAACAHYAASSRCNITGCCRYTALCLTTVTPRQRSFRRQHRCLTTTHRQKYRRLRFR